MKILKTILIVIFALVFAVSGGLLVYSVIHPAVQQDKEEFDVGGAPALALYEGGAATYDIKALVDDETIDPEKKATDIMVQAAYNLINIKQFFFNARVDVESKAGDWAFSDYHYTKNDLDTFKKAQAYTGGIANSFVLRCYYKNQKLEDKGTSDYDFDKEVWSYTAHLPGYPKAENKSHGKDDETPYYYYGTLDFPLDFGGEESADDDSTLPRSAAINYSLIDGATVEITEDEEGGYYTLTFDCVIASINDSYETKYRLSKTTADGKMENITFTKFTVTAEIWKDAGVFRKLTYTTNVHATIYGKTGDSDIEKSMIFSYDDESCSVAKKIMTVKDDKGNATFYDLLNSANKTTCDAEIKALEDAGKKSDNEE